MEIRRWIRFGGALALAMTVGGCETGSTGPELQRDFDSEAAIADYEAVQGVMQSTGWASFKALGGRTPFGEPEVAAGVVGSLGAPRAGNGAWTPAQEIATRLQAGGGFAAVQIISDHHRGSTFVYDPPSDEYVVDPDREGAPATGVRFVLYAVDASGRPNVTQEIGHADLVDEGDESGGSIVLHLTVVEGDAVLLDYLTSVEGDENRGSISVSGFLRDEQNRMDFAIEASGSEVDGRSTLDVSYEMRVDTRDFSIVGSAQGVEEGTVGEGHAQLTVRHGSESFAVDLYGEAGAIEGTFHLNGELFATVSGDAENPTFRGASGEPLTWVEFLVLHHIVDVAEDVCDFLEDLLDPVDELILLAIIL